MVEDIPIIPEPYIFEDYLDSRSYRVWQPIQYREVPPEDKNPIAWVNPPALCENDNLLDGYLNRGFCVPGYIDNQTWFTPAPEHITGKATWYSYGMMESVARNRGMNLDRFLGGVSMFSPADIGEVVWLKRPGSDWEGPYLVVDCSTRGDMYATIVYVTESVEVSFDTAVRWGMVSQNGKFVYQWGMNGVEVYKGLLPPTGSISIVYKYWFLEGVTFDIIRTRNTRWLPEMMKFTNYEEYLGELE